MRVAGIVGGRKQKRILSVR